MLSDPLIRGDKNGRGGLKFEMKISLAFRNLRQTQLSFISNSSGFLVSKLHNGTKAKPSDGSSSPFSLEAPRVSQRPISDQTVESGN